MTHTEGSRPPLLSIRGLHVRNRIGRELVPVLSGVDLDVRPGEAVGVVGESGSGKSMTLRAVMGQLPKGFSSKGSIEFDGEDVLSMRPSHLARFRSRRVGMIYQDPRAHINPLWTIGDFLTEAVVADRRLSRREARDRAGRLLEEVGFRDPVRQMKQYPGQLSGGLLQRVMIVAALMPEPQLLLADEPTTALDVTVQAEVMSIFGDVIRAHDVGLLFVTHDLDLAAATTDRLVVMYAGRIVEAGPARSVTSTPTHPYTSALLAARPSLTRRELPASIPGVPTLASSVHDRCAFADRCRFVEPECVESEPRLRPVGDDSVSACVRTHEIRNRLERIAQ